MLPFRFTGKELDEETGLYYYGARYLDPRVSRWLSADPAVGEYIPSAPVNEEARRRNGNLPGMGGVYNLVNLHVYHYAGNNPIKYTDPDGKWVYNNSSKTIVARTENGDYIFIGSGKTYTGRIDGIITQNGTIFKTSEQEGGVLRSTNIVVNEDDGVYSFSFSDLGSVAINSLGDLGKIIINIFNKLMNEGEEEYSGTYFNKAEGHPAVYAWWNNLTDENEMGDPESWDQKYSEQLSRQWESALRGEGEFPVEWEIGE
jgi:hypothetical protein